MKKKIIYIICGCIINCVILSSILFISQKDSNPSQQENKKYSTKLVYKNKSVKPKKDTNNKKSEKKEIKKKKKNIKKKITKKSKKQLLNKKTSISEKQINSKMSQKKQKEVFSILDLDSQPVITNSTQPNYPEFAKEQGVEALVILKLTIDISGSVLDIKVIQRLEGYDFDIEAIKAVKQWQFSVCTVQGKPVQYSILQPIYFKLQ